MCHLVRKIKQFFLRKKYNLAKVGRNVHVVNSFFEGCNALMHDVTIENCHIGLLSYVNHSSSLYNAKIGRFCSIADNVHFCIGQHPTSVAVSTFPSFYYDTTSQIGSTFHKGNPLCEFEKKTKGETRYDIVVENDVWIGSHALILGGVRIGTGAVVAAGAVVTKDVAPYSIVGGVPAKHIKYRFDEVDRGLLLKSEWWNKPLSEIKAEYQNFLNVKSFLGVK